MKRTLLPILTLSLVFASSTWAAEPSADQAKAIAAIEKLGGKVTVDEKSPGKPVIGVTFSHMAIPDAGLEYLKGLPNLQNLDLSETEDTDAALEHIKRLTQLRVLHLERSWVFDASLEKIEGLTQLQGLYLRGCELVTDAGLDPEQA
jgi:hypothetical protein